VNPRTLAGLAVSAIALVAVVWWASRQEAPTWPSGTGDIALLVGAVAIYALATLVRGWRWHTILRVDGIEHDRRDALGLVCVGYMGNTVLPARGGEVLRIVLLGRRAGARKREILGSILAERALDAVVLVGLFVVLTFVGVAGTPVGDAPAVVATAGLVAGAFGLWLYLRLRRAGRLQGFADRVRPVVRASRPLLGRIGALLALATVGVWLLEALIFMLVAQSLDLDLDLVDGLFVNVLASFFALIPAAPGYVGTFDAAVLFGLKALDVSGGAAVAFAVLVRFVLFVPITLVGLLLVLIRYGGLAVLRRGDDEDGR
jgi:glycosyltransferase 2 family protein